MASKQGAIFAPVPPKAEGDAVGQAPEAGPRIEMAPKPGAAIPPAVGAGGGTATWFQGILVRRRCDSCGTRISIHVERDDRVFMRCPQCLREYVFSRHPE